MNQAYRYNGTQKTMMCVFILFFASLYIYTPYQSPYLTGLGLSTGYVGLVVGTYGLCPILGRVPCGILADKNGSHKRFVLWGTGCGALANGIRVLAPNGTGFLMANVFSGLSICFWISFILLFIEQAPETFRQRATSDTVFGMNMGMLLAFVVSTLLYDRYGMRMICAIGMAACLVGFLLTLRIREEQKPAVTVSVRALLKAVANKRLLFFSACAMVQLGLQTTTAMSFTSQILKDMGASALVIGIATLVYMISAVLSARLADVPVCKRISHRAWMTCVFLLLVAYMVLVPLCKSYHWILLLQIIPGLSTGILYAYLMVEAMAKVPDWAHSTGMGLYQSIMAVGLAFFPMIGGKLADLYSMQVAYLVLSCTALAAAAALFFGKTYFRST